MKKIVRAIMALAVLVQVLQADFLLQKHGGMSIIDATSSYKEPLIITGATLTGGALGYGVASGGTLVSKLSSATVIGIMSGILADSIQKRKYRDGYKIYKIISKKEVK